MKAIRWRRKPGASGMCECPTCTDPLAAVVLDLAERLERNLERRVYAVPAAAANGGAPCEVCGMLTTGTVEDCTGKRRPACADCAPGMIVEDVRAGRSRIVGWIR